LKETHNIDRRNFLKCSAGALAFPYIIQSSALGKAGTVAPSNRINVGCIGVGPRGNDVMKTFLAEADVRVAAISDVKTDIREFVQNEVNSHYQNKDCAVYNDFRELIGRDDIDAVMIATPDHWHVLNALAAVRSGKDVYLEKPMGLSMTEDQVLREAVRRYGAVFQFGTQQRSIGKFRFACELVHNGRIGDLHTVNVWSPGSKEGGSQKLAPVPPGLDYEMWLGPAPYKPHTENRCSNNLFKGDPYKVWPFISDYCLGWIAGWGVHPLDIALWGAGEKMTGNFEIVGKGTFPSEGLCDTATDWVVKCKYDSGLTLNFTGPPSSTDFRQRYESKSGHGTAFEGTEGWVNVARKGMNAKDKSLETSSIGSNEKKLYASVNHTRNFLDCVKSRKRTISNIDEAVAVDTLCQVSAIAIQLDRKLRWDAAKEQFVNDAAANRFLKRSMRSPWHL
jgi:hypothetical protein